MTPRNGKCRCRTICPTANFASRMVRFMLTLEPVLFRSRCWADGGSTVPRAPAELKGRLPTIRPAPRRRGPISVRLLYDQCGPRPDIRLKHDQPADEAGEGEAVEEDV